MLDEKFRTSTIGIDFSDDYTQVSVFDDEFTPVSMSMIKNETKYLIPTVAFIDEQTRKWYIGDEAIARYNNNDINGKFFTDIPKLAMTSKWIEIFDDVIENIQMVSIFMHEVLKYVSINSDVRQVNDIVVSIAGSDRDNLEIIYNAFEKLDYRRPNVRVISHNESFAYYVCSQKPDIWVNSVLMLNFRDNMLVSRTLYSNSKRGPHIVTVSEETIPNITLSGFKDDKTNADIELANYLDIIFRRNVYSACFLVGEVLSDVEKLPRTMRILTQNRKVYGGHNLIAKGAGYAAREIFGDDNLEVVILCKGRTRLDIGLMVNVEGRERQLVMSKAGTNWYDANEKIECIVDKCSAAKLAITNPLTKMTNHVFINIDDFPQRGNKLTRVEIEVSYKNEETLLLTVADKGFGEFFESSGMEAKKEIRVWDYL